MNNGINSEKLNNLKTFSKAENDNLDEIKQYMIYCNFALKILENELALVSDQFSLAQVYNPIDHIKYRIKTISSIKEKARKKQIDLTVENIDREINDIVGARIICPFLSDVYQVIDLLKKNKNLKILNEKDYIKSPKACGYTSYHLIVVIPVQLNDGYREIKAEIQLRTLGMDFWASLEHQLSYKIASEIPDDLVNKLQKYSEKILDIDNDMDKLAKILLKEGS